MKVPAPLVALIVSSTLTSPALAQRAGENAATQSSDAFGKSIGSERTGLYNSDEVRGFNPVDAGNVRLEGLYFDQVDRISSRLVDRSTIRVGVGALGYPFPAPTGLVDYTLTQPDGEPGYTISIDNGNFGNGGIAGFFEFKQPLEGDRLAVSGGVGFRASSKFEGGNALYSASGATLAYRPRPGTEVLLFGGAFLTRHDEARPVYFPAGVFLPPELPRGQDLSQRWTGRNQTNWTLGGVVKAPLAGLQLEAGLFYNTRAVDEAYADLMRGVSPDGRVASRRIVADGDNFEGSLSGEMRLVHLWKTGAIDHRLVASLRGRMRDRRFGGAVVLDLGPSTLLAPDLRAEPDYVLGPKSDDAVRQLTYGLAWSMLKTGAFSLDASLSQTRYRKAVDFADPAAPDPLTRDNPLVWNLGGSLDLAKSVRLYAGISRGLEEALIAPEIATNRNEAPPAIRTRQIEAGLRWAISDRLSLVIGGFSITKPYFNLDPALRYRQLGELANKGLEFSLTGQIAPGLTLVGGTLLLDPRVSGEAVDLGLIGPRPVGQARRRSLATIDWRADGGNGPWSFDLAIDSVSSRIANVANTLSAPASTTLNLGARYRFKTAGGDWLIRAQLINLTNAYRWNVSPSGGFTYAAPRRLNVQLVADL